MRAAPPAARTSAELLARPVSQAESYAGTSVDDGTAEFDAAQPADEQLLALQRSPFVDLNHPVTLFEGVKLVLMAPVVALKAGSSHP